jgi:hypothetical protein
MEIFMRSLLGDVNSDDGDADAFAGDADFGDLSSFNCRDGVFSL